MAIMEFKNSSAYVQRQSDALLRDFEILTEFVLASP